MMFANFIWTVLLLTGLTVVSIRIFLGLCVTDAQSAQGKFICLNTPNNDQVGTDIQDLLEPAMVAGVACVTII